MRRLTTALGAVALSVIAASTTAAPTHAATPNPTQVCRDLQANAPELYEFIATKPGACVSTIASVGLEALEDMAFPSNAAAIGNCKFLESVSFFRDPAPAHPYPYTFHGEFADVNAVTGLLIAEFGLTAEQAAGIAPMVVANFMENSDRFTANNRAGCVRVLRGLHSGELFGLLFEGTPLAG